MKKLFLTTSFTVSLLLLPGLSLAWSIGDSLVPNCDGVGSSPSDFVGPTTGTRACDWGALFQLFNNLLQFAIWISAFVGGIAVCWAGLMFLMYSTNEAKRSRAKVLLKRVVIGFGAVLAAALIVKTILDVFLDPNVLPNPISVILSKPWIG